MYRKDYSNRSVLAGCVSTWSLDMQLAEPEQQARPPIRVVDPVYASLIVLSSWSTGKICTLL